MQIVECVPNFSEGRRLDVIKAIVDSISSVSEVTLLGYEFDKDHNRSVVTFVGTPEGCKEAAFRAVAKATELIDMNKHKGVHPRIGATDVVPFVPIANVDLQDCVLLAKALGKQIAEELSIPVYLYEAAATRPDRVDLANIRKGEYERLKVEIETNPDRKPDYGASKLHPTAGATVVGARMPLIAFNVYLNTSDVTIAKKIAKSIRARNGGLPFVKALGLEIKERGVVQISMNITNYKATPLHLVVDTIRELAKKYGVSILGSEIVGFTPLDALLENAQYYLKLESFNADQILDLKTAPLTTEQSLKKTDDFLDRVASASATPGGGAVSALAGALGAALLAMVIKHTPSASAKKFLTVVEKNVDELRTLVDKDIDAFNSVTAAYKLPKGTANRDLQIQNALKNAAYPPEKVSQLCMELLRIAEEVFPVIKRNTISDFGTGVAQLVAALQGGELNMTTNMNAVKDKKWRRSKLKIVSTVRQNLNYYSDFLKRINTKLS